MKSHLRAALLLAIIAGCSDPTTATITADLNPSFARGGKPQPGAGNTTGPTTIAVNDSFSFEAGAPATTSTFSTELQPGVVGTASDPDIETAPAGQRFLGRFPQTATDILLSAPAGHPRYSLSFDLYIIGSWDGKGKQAQSGVFQANVVQIGYRCGSDPAITDLFLTTFSNQLTVQQDFPLSLGLGGNKAGTGSIAKDALNYRSRSDLSNTPPFRSFGDITYRLSFAGPNPCGTGAIAFVWGTSNPRQQSLHDESWGIDNISLKLGS